MKAQLYLRDSENRLLYRAVPGQSGLLSDSEASLKVLEYRLRFKHENRVDKSLRGRRATKPINFNRTLGDELAYS